MSSKSLLWDLFQKHKWALLWQKEAENSNRDFDLSQSQSFGVGALWVFLDLYKQDRVTRADVEASLLWLQSCRSLRRRVFVTSAAFSGLSTRWSASRPTASSTAITTGKRWWWGREAWTTRRHGRPTRSTWWEGKWTRRILCSHIWLTVSPVVLCLK